MPGKVAYDLKTQTSLVVWLLDQVKSLVSSLAGLPSDCGLSPLRLVCVTKRLNKRIEKELQGARRSALQSPDLPSQPLLVHQLLYLQTKSY